MITYKDISINEELCSVRKDDRFVHLTKTQYRLFLILLEHVGQICTREYLLSSVWHSQQPPPEGGGLKSRRIPIILTQWIFTARFRPYDQVSMSFHRCCGRHSRSEESGFMRDIIPTIQHYVCLWQRCGRGYVLYRSRCMSSFCLLV